MMPIFRGVLEHSPNPVPTGDDVEAYFNKHYQELGPSPAYPWFQSRMNVAAYEEKPSPRFVQALFSLPEVGVSQDCRIIVPDASDGVLISPQNHKVLYETEDVRVMEVTVAPHTKETTHTHVRPAVMYLDQPGAYGGPSELMPHGIGRSSISLVSATVASFATDVFSPRIPPVSLFCRAE